MKRVLVTGGAGFLGQRLIALLLNRGLEVRCLARTDFQFDHDESSVGASGKLEVRRIDLNRLDRGTNVTAGCDIVFHLASGLKGSTSGLFQTNVVGTRVLMDASALTGVQRFVLVSSLGVYGTAKLRPGEVLDESCPLDPEPHRRDPYTYSKVAQEEAAQETASRTGLPLVVVRPGVIYGPKREVITARVGLRAGNFVLQMGGGHRLPYIYVDNCADGIFLAGTVVGVEGKAFNLVDDELPTGRQVLRAYRRSVGRVRSLTVPDPAVQILSWLCLWYHEKSGGQLPAIFTPYRSDALWKPLRYVNIKAKEELGWFPEVGLDAGLCRTFEWLKRHRGVGPS